MVVYTTDNGFCSFKGSAMLQSLLAEDISKKVQDADLWTDEPLVRAAPTTKVILPLLPGPLQTLNAKTLQKLIPAVMRGINGGHYVRWADVTNKPDWWPEDVCFANPKQRPAGQGDGKCANCFLNSFPCSKKYNNHCSIFILLNFALNLSNKVLCLK